MDMLDRAYKTLLKYQEALPIALGAPILTLGAAIGVGIVTPFLPETAAMVSMIHAVQATLEASIVPSAMIGPPLFAAGLGLGLSWKVRDKWRSAHGTHPERWQPTAMDLRVETPDPTAAKASPQMESPTGSLYDIAQEPRKHLRVGAEFERNHQLEWHDCDISRE